jgi:NDP-sugar pyrophosphorylase family protein
VVVNLHHRPESLARSLDEAAGHCRVHRLVEERLLGTAGGLKNAASFLREGTFLLMNGDTLAEFDLPRLAQEHRQAGAKATLLLRAKPAGTHYSGIRLGEGQRILAVERKESSSAWMFAGVWLLEPSLLDALSGEPVGLEEELLPRLIREGSAIGSFSTGAWLTVDTPRRYWESSLAAARDGLFEEDWAVRSRPIEVVDGAPAHVLAGPDTRIDEGVRFRGSVVLGARCCVCRGSRLENVVLWDDVVVSAGVTLSNSVVTHGVSLPEGASLEDKIILKLGADRSGLRRKEIRDGLVVAELKTGRTSSL